MKHAKYLIIVLFIKSTPLFGQGFYLKASSNYNISSSKQRMPDYFTYRVGYWGGSQILDFIVNDFSIASGSDLQGTAGYSFNDFLSLELKLSAFRNSKKEFKVSPDEILRTNWDLRNFSLLPTILLGKTFNKSTINIFICTGLGYSKLNLRASLHGEGLSNLNFREYEFDRSYTFSWGYGLEYTFSISNKLSIFSNIGINNTYYIPEKAHLISTGIPMQYLTTSEKEIQFVNNITNLDVLSYYYYSSDPNKPDIKLKETLKLNSIYLGFGIKYTLKK